MGAAPAEAALLKGTVTGSPYVATPQTSAVPVLFSKQSAKHAGLLSPVGVVIVPRRTKLNVPGGEGSVLPGRLRLGDRFRVNLRVPRAAKKAVYTRLAVKRGFTVTKRSRTLSNDELTLQLNQLRADLTALTAYTANLVDYTVKGFTYLDARIGQLERDIAELRRNITSLQRQLGTLTDQLAALRGDLERQIAGLDARLGAQLATLTSALAALEGKLGDLTAPCGAGPFNMSTVAGQLCALKAALPVGDTLTTIGSLTTRVDGISSSLTSVLNTLTGLQLTGDITGAAGAQVQQALQTIFGLAGNLGSLAKQVDLTAATNAITAVDTKVGAALPNGQTISGLLSSLNGQMTSLNAALATGSGSAVSAAALEAQIAAATAAVQANVDAIELYLSPTDGGTLGGANDLVATQIASVTGSIGTVRASVRTTCADAQAALEEIRTKLIAAPTVLTSALTGMTTNCAGL